MKFTEKQAKKFNADLAIIEIIAKKKFLAKKF